MPIKLLCAALLTLPLLGPFTLSLLSIPDIWKAKDLFAMLFIMAIVAFSYYRPRPARARNPFLAAMLIYLPVSAVMAPPINMQYGHANLGGLWIWEGMAWVFAYFMLYESVGRMVLTPRHKGMIAKAIGWGAILSAGYAYLQTMGLDQWQFVRPFNEIGNSDTAGITALMQNPTFLGVYLVMCLPFLVLFFPWWWAVFVGGAVLACQSDIATLGMVFVLVFMAAIRFKALMALAWAGVLVLALLWAFWPQIGSKMEIHASGRFQVWEQTLRDWRGPCIKMPIKESMSDRQKDEIQKLNQRTYTLTGRGLNSFRFIFGPKYTNPYEAAHSEPIEALYSIGIIGTVLFVLMVGWALRKGLAGCGEPFILAVYTSFLFCCLASFGLHILHAEPTRFYAAVFFCLLSI